MSRVFIIAEAGVNHNGDLAMAKRLVQDAARAGADAVKFQTFRADRLAARTARKAEYQERDGKTGESQVDMLRKLELDAAAHAALAAECAARGISFMSTPFDPESVELLRSFEMAYWKIPSGEITNLPHLRHVGGLGKHVILSTGMADLGEIEDALLALEEAGTPRDCVTVLHATTEYPAPMSEINLRAMRTIADAFGVAVGYSDHTVGIEISVAAAALGAAVIEKHFTLDRSLPGPDHAASLEPRELEAMVSAIRNVEAALGDGRKAPTPSERRNMAVARKSIVAARPIRAGEILGPDNLAAKRPGTGLSPMRWDELVGRTAVRDYQTDEAVGI